MIRPHLLIALVLPALLLTACDDTAPTAQTDPDAPAAEACGDTEAPSTTRSVAIGELTAASALGTYHITARAIPDPTPLNEPFALDITVHTDEARTTPAHDVRLHIDAAMPQHEHGMNTRPQVTPLGDGRFRAEGLLFHMAGDWQLYIDVSRGPVTERAVFDVAMP